MILKKSEVESTIRKTFHKILKVAAMAMALFAVMPAADDVKAQTCRVSMGVNAEGHKTYMEVYEYDYVTEKPTFPGGDSKLMEFINENRHYPKGAYKAGIQGRVTCSFIVNANGSISHVRVLRGVEESLNKEALRVFSSMPDWMPGRIENRQVPVRVIWSIPFRK